MLDAEKIIAKIDAMPIEELVEKMIQALEESQYSLYN